MEVAWSPEFVREGTAVADTLCPERLVFGVASAAAAGRLRRVHASTISAGVPALVMDVESAEVVKVAANAFLAMKLSFINAVAEVCEVAGADVRLVARALALDGRIGGRFLAPGLGYGGGCLPKDVRAFRAAALGLGVPDLPGLLGAVDAINLRCRRRTVDLARAAVGGSLAGRRIGVLGVAFKPGSDDVRDSASLEVCDQLAAEGAIVTVHDPAAMANAARTRPGLRCAASARDAAAGAHVVLHLTEWPEYHALEPASLAPVVARQVIIDARSALDRQLWTAAGWTFRALGQP